MLGNWWTRLTGYLSCTALGALSFIRPLTLMTYGQTGYYGLADEGAMIGELPAGHTIFSFGAFTKIISRRRFR